LDTTYDDNVDKIYYCRMIARNIQKLRLEANLHPWDKINSYWSGESKYDLNNDGNIKYIEDITRIKFSEIKPLINDMTFIKEIFVSELNIKLYLG
jgi:hypothetical protein